MSKIPPILKHIKNYYERKNNILTLNLLDELKAFQHERCCRKICEWCPSACEDILGYNFRGGWCILTLMGAHDEKRDVVMDALNAFLTKNETIEKITQKTNKVEVCKMETKSMINTVKKTANVASIISIFAVAFVLAVYKILKTDGLFEYDLRLRDWSKKLLGKMEALIKLIK